MKSIVISGASATNHAATGSRCADEGLASVTEMKEGQTWGYFSDEGQYVTDSLGDRCLVSTSPILLEFYSLISRVSPKKARHLTHSGLGPRAAKSYTWWQVAVTSAKTGVITTRIQSFPKDLSGSGYRRIS